MQYPHTAWACVWEPVFVCLLKISSPILVALLTYSHQKTITRTLRHSETSTHLVLLIANTVSMLGLTTQQALIPLPVTFNKQD